jgi:acyl carrier protein
MRSWAEQTVQQLLLAQVTPGRNAISISPETLLVELGLDSLALMAFWVSFERQLGISLDASSMQYIQLRTVGDVLTLAAAMVSSSGNHMEPAWKP